MKKCLFTAGIAVFVILAASVCQAASSETVNVLVTIERAISIEVAGGPVDFGQQSVSATAVSTSAVTVKNNGSGADETATLSFTDPSGWTHGVPGVNVYRLSFQFNATQPLVGDANWKASGEIAEGIAYNATKNLWVKLETPTATNVGTQQSIPLTITAQ